MKELKDIEVGDRVWVSAPYSGDRGDLHTVKHLTPTQVHLDGFRQKFNRGKPTKYSREPSWYGIGSTRGRILSIATAEEAAAWDKKIAQQQADLDARKQRESEAATKREELTALFSANEDENQVTTVRSAEYGDREARSNRYAVTFHNLTESEVRELAKVVA